MSLIDKHPEGDWRIKAGDFGSVTGSDIWDPASGKRIILTDMVVSTSSATVVTVFWDTDDTDHRLMKAYFAANQGAIPTISGLIVLPKDAVIKVTNSNPTVSITCIGVEAG